jgi:ABC-2 type transport system permease protein
MFADPVGRMLMGPGTGSTSPTYERFIANGYGLYLLLLAALMSILLVVRHTRARSRPAGPSWSGPTSSAATPR